MESSTNNSLALCIARVCCALFFSTVMSAQTFVDVDLAPGGIVHDGNLQAEPMKIGTGAAWFDANADGHLDLYLTMRLSPNMLWIGDGRGNFVESAAQYGVADSTDNGAGVAAADFNNDGFTDLFLANGLVDRLFRNNGGVDFTDITTSAGFDMTLKSRGTSASWADFNNDGFLDLYVTNHNPIPDTPNAPRQDRLYLNNGDETFADVSNLLSATGTITGYGFIGGWTDFDHDGDPDLVLINDCFAFDPIPNQFFRNDGDTDSLLLWKFTEIGDSLGINYCENGMGLAIGDYNRDGWMDYYYSNIGPSVLMKNTGGAYTDVSTIAGVNGQDGTLPLPDYSWGTCFADVNLDGWSDLYLVLGTYHYPSSTYPQYNMFFLNNQNGIDFTDCSDLYNLADSTKGRTVVSGDYDEDGDPDFALVNYGEEIILKRNDIHQTGHYLKVDLVGVTSNRDGIGAKLTIRTPDTTKQYWEMRSGSSLGGGDALTALFGLGANAQVDTLKINWPSGCVQTVTNIPADQRIVIEEFDPDSAVVSFVDVALLKGIDATCGTCGVGNGVSFADFNDDGWDDLTFGTEGGDSILFYENTGSGFVKLPSLVNSTCKQEQVLWVDLDNDGDKDFVVTCFMGQNRIYENTGDLQLVDVTTAAGIATQNTPSYGVVAADYDEDGDLDLYFANWSFDDIHTNYLYTNDGDLTFTDNTGFAGVSDGYMLTFCSAFFDYDGDGLLDLYNSQDRDTDPNSLFKNNGDGTFTDVSVASGANIAIDAMNVGVGDYDVDGDFDVYITNTPPGNVLLQNQGDGTFEDVAEDVGVAMYKATWGGNWIDADHDKDLDLYVSSMHMGSACSSELFLNQYPQDTFYSMTFTGDSLNSFSNAIGDFNNDGLADIAVNNAKAVGGVSGCNPPGDPVNKFHLWENQSMTGSHWLNVKLRGIESNRDGIGSLIELYIDGNKYIRTTVCGTAYLAQNSFTEFFGLGTSLSADSLKVFWPSGNHVTVLHQVMGDQLITIYQTDKLYVDANATGVEDGLTWEDAFTDLQDALAFASSCHIKEIWIADGVYHPSDSNRTESFALPSDVRVYGGFAGGETLLNQRNPNTNQVILSGDIGVSGDSLDNSYHVVHVDVGSMNCFMDGVSIIAGQADGPASMDKLGAGVFCSGQLTLQDVMIDECVALSTGSAVYATGANARLVLQDVIANTNENQAGSIFVNTTSAILTITGSTEITNE